MTESVLWFVCKFCTRAFQQAKDLIEHKKSHHHDQFMGDRKKRRAEKKETKRRKRGQNSDHPTTITTTSSESTESGFVGKALLCRLSNDDDKDKEDGDEEKEMEAAMASQVNIFGETDTSSNNRTKTTRTGNKFFKNPRRRCVTGPTFGTKKRKEPRTMKEVSFCSYCHKVYYSQGGLQAHERTHTGERPYKCRYCDEAFTFPIQRIRHQNIFHNNPKDSSSSSTNNSHGGGGTSSSRRRQNNSFMWTSMSIFVRRKAVQGGISFSCVFCDREFSILGKAATHVLSHTTEDEEEEEEQSFVERGDEESQNNNNKLWRPFNTGLPPTINQINEDSHHHPNNNDDDGNNKIVKIRNRFQCTDCTVTFSHLASVRRHHKNVHQQQQTE